MSDFFSIWYYHICTCIQNMNLYYYYQCIKWIAICIFLSCGDEKWLERVSTMKWKCQNFSMSTVIWYKWEELWLWQKFQLPSRREWTLKINLIFSCFLKKTPQFYPCTVCLPRKPSVDPHCSTSTLESRTCCWSGIQMLLDSEPHKDPWQDDDRRLHDSVGAWEGV